MTASSFMHPAWGFIALALILPFFKGRAWRWLLLVPPIGAITAMWFMDQGTYGVISYLGQKLTLGRVDTLSMVFASVFALQSLIGMIYSFHVKEKAHHAAASLYVAGAFGSVFAGDYLTLFIFWELMSVSSTFLVWLRRREQSTRAGLRYFLFHTLGGLFLLAGLLLRYQAIGNFDFIAVDPAGAQYYDWLILAGFCVNAAVAPLHAWLPDTYPEATIPGAVFMCAFTTKTAVYVLIRAFSGFEILALAGTVMAVYGVLYACIENNARRILSYHIVSQVGYMVAGIGIGTHLTINGAVSHAYAHIIYKGLLFMATGCILHAVGTDKLDRLGGLVGKLPWVMVLYMVGAVSISGVPMFNGFISKTMTIHGAAEAERYILALALEIAAVGTFLSVGLKLPYFAFWAKPEKKREIKPIPVNMYVAMGIAALFCLAQGVYPQMLYRLLPHSVEYEPFTAWGLLQACLLLGFTGLGFYLMRGIIVPHAGRNLDFDMLYRAVGNLMLKLLSVPLAFLDAAFSDVYRKLGLKGLMGIARLSSLFDRNAIDGVVDGTAYTVKSIGDKAVKIQTGRLQDYLAWALVGALAIFTAVWWLTEPI